MKSAMTFWIKFIFIKVLYFFSLLAEKIPFFGTRFWCAGIKAHKMAAYEFLFTAFFSALPLWLGSIIIMGVSKDTPDTFQGLYSTLVALVNRGDLFLYCTSILTAVSWLNIKHSINSDDNGAEEEDVSDEDISDLREKLNLQGKGIYKKPTKSVYPPNKFLFLSFALFGFVVSVAFYALNLAEIIVNPELLRTVSTSVYGISLMLYHNVLVSDHAGFGDYEEISSLGTEKFVSGYAAHRQGGES